jgi:outer membrane biosynthesis protein TonB
MSVLPRNLRIGIVYRGAIVHEEVLDRRIDVSVGLRAGATIQLPAKQYPDFPDAIDVLAIEGNQYYLVVPQDPNARISLRGTTTAAAPVMVKGKRCLPAEAAAGGSIVLGDVSIMFQFVRADTTPMVTRERTVLRIGLVFDERLISDRIFPDDRKVSIGNGKDQQIVLPPDDYQGPPLHFVNNKDGSVTMRVPAAISSKVRVAVDGSPMELKDLQAKGKARQEGNDVICHLALGTRGRATLGEHTVLFQVVKQTLIVPATPPKSLGQKLLSPFMGDPTWSLSFLIAFLLTTSIVGQALLFQQTTGRYLNKAKAEEELANTTYEVVIEQKEEVKAPEPEKETIDIKSDEAKKAEEKEVAKADDKPSKAAKADEKPQSTGKTVEDLEERRRNARETVAKTTIAGAFMNQGGAATKLFGEAGEGEAGDVVAKQFGGDGGDAGDANGPGGGLKLAGGGGGGATMEKVNTGKAKGFGAREASETKVEAKKEEAKVNIKLSMGEMGGSGEAKSDIAKVVSRKNSAVQRCYEQALRDNPEEGGKVKVIFTVGTAGTITDVTVSGAAGAFSDCIKNKFLAIRGLPTLPAPQSFNQSYVFAKN